jgi:hypothetical protein
MHYAKCLGLAVGMICGALGTHPAAAVVIAAGDGTGNTTASGAFADAFAHVGTNGNSLVYLGNGVILTANHVYPSANPSGTVNINGNTYSLVSNSKTRLHAPGDTGNLDDLALLQIDISGGNPGGVLPLGTALPGATVRMVGNGWNRATNLTTWYVDTDTDPYTWSESNFTGADAIATGFKTVNSQSLRWGENVIDGAPNSGVDAVNLATVFTDSAHGGLTDEAQGVEHDSGGGVFQFNVGTNQWELVGLTVGVGLYSGQPGGSTSALYGDLTYFADLSAYRTQIDSYMATVPEPATLTLLGFAGLLGVRRRIR